MTLIPLTVLIVIIIVAWSFDKFLAAYDKKRDNLLYMAVNGDVPASVLISSNKPHPYRILFRNRQGEIETYMTQPATNELEAQYDFIMGNGDTINIMSILEVIKL